MKAGISTKYPKTVTFYDAFSAGWDGLKTTSKVRAHDVYYRWENSTSAVFFYVRLESETDDYQNLAFVTTKCNTAFSYTADIDEWSQNADGSWGPAPSLDSGSGEFETKPGKYNNVYYAVEAHVTNPLELSSDVVSSIEFKGPEDKTIGTIYPCNPSFPLQCE